MRENGERRKEQRTTETVIAVDRREFMAGSW